MALTGALVLYHKNLTLEYAAVQSLRVFPNLPLFGGIYYTWLATLVSLAFLPSRIGSTLCSYEGTALVGVFSLGYRGMWDILLPDYWADGLSNIITAQFIMDGGTITAVNQNIAYLDYPGLHIMAAMLAQTTRQDAYFAAVVILLVLDVMTATLLYLIANRLLKDPRRATLTALLGMIGNPLFAYYFFYPGYLGVTLFFVFLLTLLRFETTLAPAGWILVLLGATISHFVSSLAFAFALVGVAATGGVLRRSQMSTISSVALFAIIPVAWLTYATATTFPNLAILSSRVFHNFTENGLFWLTTVARGHLGGSQPLWASGIRFFWLFTLYGLGTLGVLLHLLRLNEAGTPYKAAVGAFCGLTLLSVVATLASFGGDQFIRFLMFAPALTAPFLVKALLRLPVGRSTAVGTLALVTFLIAFPTFLVYRSPVEMYTYYPVEYAAGQFISSATSGNRVEVYSLALSRMPVLRYNTHGLYRDEGQVNIDLIGEEGLWRAAYGLERRFRTGPASAPLSLFLYSARSKVYYRHLFGIAPTSRQWTDLERRLLAADSIYDSDSVRVYVSRLQ